MLKISARKWLAAVGFCAWLGGYVLPNCFGAEAASGDASEPNAPHALAISPYRRYFWGARRAFNRRDFKEAERMFKTYERLGMPPDPLVVQSGCPLDAEVSQFAAQLKDVKACLAQKQQSGKSWPDFERAKLDTLRILASGAPRDLEPYIECAPVDLTFQGGSCAQEGVASLDALPDLFAKVRSAEEILEMATWTYYPPSQPPDPISLPYILHTHSLQWTPAQMNNAGILSLRQNTKGEVHIAGFAASGLR
jgi:hypothetical protein